MKKFNKKGIFGSGLTWFSATLIIFVILIIYIGVVIILVSQKGSFYVNNEKDVGSSSPLLFNQRELIGILNEEASSGKTVKESLIEISKTNNNNLRKDLERDLKSIYEEDVSEDICYFITAISDINDKKSVLVSIERGIGVASASGVFSLDPSYFSSQVDIFVENGKINIKSYKGPC